MFGVRHIYHCAKLYLNNVKVWEMGQYDLVKDDLYKIFDYPFLNLKGLTSKTFNLLKVEFTKLSLPVNEEGPDIGDETDFD